MIELRNLSMGQGTFSLQQVSLRVEAGEYAILMGETGCGKTTLVEAICGIRPIDQGQVLLRESDVTHWPVARRQIGYVPQDGALFPTMRVDQQILFGLQVRNVEQRKCRQRLEELVETLSLEKILSRYPNRLSGGERQRVALARALAFEPGILCLDEPLSALDQKTHRQLTGYLRSIHERESVTILHVTHNLNEAIDLGTVRFRLQEGRIEKMEQES
ncbi:MAG: ABC transporter ATP-binding protein [Planctomycetota bacterium]|nr:ABC transporter ATP-binding protein [Planctomycetota bacterium]